MTESSYTRDTFYTQAANSETSESYTKRWDMLSNSFTRAFRTSPQIFCSLPGRIEIIGNHLDHARGAVVAAGINLDIRACAKKHSDNRIQCYSVGIHKPLIIDLTEDLAPQRNTDASIALMQGVCKWLQQHGYHIGGMQIFMHSSIPSGMGLSSSAAFSCCIAFLLSKLYNNGTLTSLEICSCAQFAESKYMGKPCGLMDQIASVYGGLNHISFAEETPIITKLDTSSNDTRWIVSTYGAGHGDKSSQYAAIQKEMHGVARIIGVDELGLHDVLTANDPTLWKQVFSAALVQKIQKKYTSRALLRTMHFVQERTRVEAFKEAVSADDSDTMKQLIRASGNSSWMMLQNVIGENDTYEYALLLAATMQADAHLGTASRVHGGGFGGSVISLVDDQVTDAFIDMLASYCPGVQSQILHIRPLGTTEITW